MTWCPPIPALAYDPLGRPIVSVLTKRTYAIRPDGRTVVADEPLPLDTTDQPPAPGYDPSWRGEIDGAPYKIATDVVLFGEAHAPGGACTSMAVEVGLPELQRLIRLWVTGDRRCAYRPGGAPAVSDPEPFETMPLGYDRAYGGVDPHVEFPAPPVDGAEALAMLMTIPGAYPRNPVGRGFAVGNRKERIDGLALPNIERADRPLRADLIVCPDMREWARQPLPAGLGWIDPAWFPRGAFGCALPLFPAPADTAEVELGFLPPDFNQRFALPAAAEDLRFDYRLFNGASLGLAVPLLRGDEVITTVGLTPEGRCDFRLPGDRPRVLMRLGGRPLETELAAHTVGVLMAERLVYVVWRASALLPDDFRPRTATFADPSLTGLDGFEVSISS